MLAPTAFAAIPAGSLISIYANSGHPRSGALVGALEGWLTARGYRPARNAAAQAGAALAVVFGGDGSMLHVAPELAAAATPVLAVHLGTLGFLTDTTPADLYPSLDAILSGRGVEARRAMLHVQLERAGAVVEDFEALNEAVIAKSGLARLLSLTLAIDGQPVTHYRADGVLVATPTGSTGYNLSAGGSIVHPDVAALLITPICPNALAERPLLVPAAAQIRLTLTAGEPAFLTVDGQRGLGVARGDAMEVTQTAHALRCVAVTPRARFSPSSRPVRADIPR